MPENIDWMHNKLDTDQEFAHEPEEVFLEHAVDSQEFTEEPVEALEVPTEPEITPEFIPEPGIPAPEKKPQGRHEKLMQSYYHKI
jgi:hypothetical protein